MKRFGLLPLNCLLVIIWISGCDLPEPSPTPLVQLVVEYSPKSFMPGDTVTFKVEIKNISDSIIKPQPKVSSFVLNEIKAIVTAPESPPYVTSLDPGESIYKTFKVELKCKNRVSIKASVPGVGWEGKVYAQPCLNFYQDCVDRVNKLRALENLSPLVREQDGEDSSDKDAYQNYATKTPHSSFSGDAQNECGLYSAISLILDDCIEKQMYYAEKSCYVKNSSSCYADKACQCGHYLNITNKSFTKIACGLYEAPDGKFKAVLNFFK